MEKWIIVRWTIPVNLQARETNTEQILAKIWIMEKWITAKAMAAFSETWVHMMTSECQSLKILARRLLWPGDVIFICICVCSVTEKMAMGVVMQRNIFTPGQETFVPVFLSFALLPPALCHGMKICIALS